MGHCPICGLELRSTAQAAQTLGVTDSRVRALVDPRQRRLPAARVGWGWIVPAQALTEFHPQPTGVHLPAPAGHTRGRQSPTCPRCGERFLDVRRAARELGLSESGVYAILGRYAHRLSAFRVGQRWYVPHSGLEAYRVRDNGTSPDDRRDTSAVIEVRVEVEPPPCRCAAYPFPHRPGGGKCPNGPKRRRKAPDKTTGVGTPQRSAEPARSR